MDDPRPGDRVGAYLLDAELGRGSMGIVFRASAGAEHVALKVLHASVAADETHQRRFEREARIARELRHPNIVPVVDSGVADGRPYIATRLVGGETLAERLERHGALPDGEVVALVAGVAAALDVLHAGGLVHRDVKPPNVLLEPDGTPLLTDFGLARAAADTVLTLPGRVSGTVDYLAPELILGGPASPGGDIYALGCLTYECLAGAPPFAGRPVADVVVAHLQEEPSPLGSPLGAAVVRALAKEPRDRPPTATAYALMLRVSARV